MFSEMSGVKVTKDIKKLERHYYDKFKYQNDKIKFLSAELFRIKDLAKKFLTPEQMLYIDVMDHQEVNPMLIT